MKKKFFTLTALVLVTVMLLALAACGSGGSGDALKGSWSGTDENGAVTWTFDGSGKCEMKTDALDSKGTYTIDGSNVSIQIELWDSANTYAFTVADGKLSLKGSGAAPDYTDLKKA